MPYRRFAIARIKEGAKPSYLREPEFGLVHTTDELNSPHVYLYPFKDLAEEGLRQMIPKKMRTQFKVVAVEVER